MSVLVEQTVTAPRASSATDTNSAIECIVNGCVLYLQIAYALCYQIGIELHVFNVM